MKKITFLTIILAINIVPFIYAGQNAGHKTAVNNSATVATLTEKQKAGLVFMYQEEKMARDVYISLGKTWGSRVFLNIQKSEQRHMDSVKSLLIKYSIDIPVPDTNIGTFKNQELQKLYNQLIEQGETSQQDAFKAGVLVEKTDIKDLEERMANVPADINSVYSQLLRGSNNHLNAFNRMLSNDSRQGSGGRHRYGKQNGKHW